MSETCLFCEKKETAFVEVLCFDAHEQVSRITLKSGVCADHANQEAQGASAAVPPLYDDCKPYLEALHVKQFGQLPTRWGLRYFPYDSPTGQAVRMHRQGFTDPRVKKVHNPLMAMGVDRVTEAEFKEAFGIEQPGRGAIVSDLGAKPKP